MMKTRDFVNRAAYAAADRAYRDADGSPDAYDAAYAAAYLAAVGCGASDCRAISLADAAARGAEDA
jgi:hypothetical protein